MSPLLKITLLALGSLLLVGAAAYRYYVCASA